MTLYLSRLALSRLVTDLHYQDELDNETFGDLAEGDPGDLPAFFTTGSSGDQEFTRWSM